MIKQELTHLTVEWGAPKLVRGGRVFGLGYWGQHAPALFTENEASVQEATRFYHYQTAAQLFNLTGVALVVADLIYMSKSDLVGGKQLGIAYGLLGGALATGITGAVLADIASAHLSRALVAYNEGLVDRILGPQTQASLYLSPMAQGVQAGATLRF